jgi:hypothetical protein
MSAQVQGKNIITECRMERVPVFETKEDGKKIRTTMAPDGAYGTAEALLFGLVPMPRWQRRKPKGA